MHNSLRAMAARSSPHKRQYAQKEDNDMTTKDICERYKLSQTALAKRFGIPLRTVQAWYLGERTPPDYVVNMMVEILSRADTSER